MKDISRKRVGRPLKDDGTSLVPQRPNKRVIAVCQELGIKNAVELAARVNVKLATAESWLRSVKPPQYCLMRFSQVLGVNPSYLTGKSKEIFKPGGFSAKEKSDAYRDGERAVLKAFIDSLTIPECKRATIYAAQILREHDAF